MGHGGGGGGHGGGHGGGFRGGFGLRGGYGGGVLYGSYWPDCYYYPDDPRCYSYHRFGADIYAPVPVLKALVKQVGKK